MNQKKVVFKQELFGLRQQAHYWQALHARAVKREAILKEQAQQLEEEIRRQQELNKEQAKEQAQRLEKVVREQEAKIKKQAQQLEEQAQQIAALKAKIIYLQKQLFGRKSEENNVTSSEEDGEQQSSSCDNVRRKRGKQPGAKGYGRKRRLELPKEEITYDLPEEQKRCPNCGKEFAVFPGTEDSEEIDWEVRLIRRIHRRKRYCCTCNCQAVPGVVTAPSPTKLIPKGMFSTGFWVRLLMEKFLFQRPLYRVRQVLALEGLHVSQGTLTGGLMRIGELVQPLYTGIVEHTRKAQHWHIDETGWMVFVEMEGKTNHRWWLWVVVSHDACVFLVDPSRSAQVPKKLLGEDAQGIISSDRLAVYRSLEDKFSVAFCWSHVRRDYIRIRDAYKNLRTWAENWLDRINDLFKRNKKRLELPPNSEAFNIETQSLRESLDEMEEIYQKELTDPLHPAQKKALNSLLKHWAGLTIFVDHPEIPMDNNEAERQLRNPVVGRKNYYGCGSIWSGMLASILFTIFQTLRLNNINPQKFLFDYFQTCAENSGQPPENPDAFLPWNLSDEQKAKWLEPEHT